MLTSADTANASEVQGERQHAADTEAGFAAIRPRIVDESANARSDLHGPLIARNLDVAFADDLPTTFTPPDELVQGLLTSGAGSLLYGASNSGKTFFALDIGCAVALGVPWLGRKTEPGLVVYLAAESPSSVRSRLQAYQQRHRVRVPNFAIVQSPIDLFAGDDDTDAVISLVKAIEAERGKKVQLIIGDTLARLSAGAWWLPSGASEV